MLQVLHMKLASSSACVNVHADTHVTAHTLLVAFTVLPRPSCHQPRSGRAAEGALLPRRRALLEFLCPWLPFDSVQDW